MLLSLKGVEFFLFVLIEILLDSISIFQVCFVNKAELQAAVDVYIEQNCGANTTNSECSIGGRSIAQTYGWPIGAWCVSQVTDMSLLFYEKDTFNVPGRRCSIDPLTWVSGISSARRARR